MITNSIVTTPPGSLAFLYLVHPNEHQAEADEYSNSNKDWEKTKELIHV